MIQLESVIIIVAFRCLLIVTSNNFVSVYVNYDDDDDSGRRSVFSSVDFRSTSSEFRSVIDSLVASNGKNLLLCYVKFLPIFARTKKTNRTEMRFTLLYYGSESGDAFISD